MQHHLDPLETLIEPKRHFISDIVNTALVHIISGNRRGSDIPDEVALRFDQGFERVKVMLHGQNLAFDRQLCQRVTKRFERVAIDAHWNFTTATDALRYLRPLDDLGLEFIEDPFAASDWRMTHAVAEQLKTPIAAGEDVYGLQAIDTLTRGISILRVDATTYGGITGALEATAIAAAAGKTVFPHVFAELHTHLACATPGVDCVEIIPDDVGADPLHHVLDQLPHLVDGRIRPSDQPGVGVQIAWDRAAQFTTQSQTLEATS